MLFHLSHQDGITLNATNFSYTTQKSIMLGSLLTLLTRKQKLINNTHINDGVGLRAHGIYIRN